MSVNFLIVRNECKAKNVLEKKGFTSGNLQKSAAKKIFEI